MIFRRNNNNLAKVEYDRRRSINSLVQPSNANNCFVSLQALTFYRCNYLTVEDLTIKNGQQMHVSFEESKNVIASGLTVTAPEDSPNTDGIHITNTQNIQILNTVIGTGILNLHVPRFKTIKVNFLKFLNHFRFQLLQVMIVYQ